MAKTRQITNKPDRRVRMGQPLTVSSQETQALATVGAADVARAQQFWRSNAGPAWITLLDAKEDAPDIVAPAT